MTTITVERELLERLTGEPLSLDFTKAQGQLRTLLSQPQAAPPVAVVPYQWSKSLGSCWPSDEDYPQGDWSIGTVDENGISYEVVRVEASQYDAEGESQKIAEAIVKLWSADAAMSAKQQEGKA